MERSSWIEGRTKEAGAVQPARAARARVIAPLLLLLAGSCGVAPKPHATTSGPIRSARSYPTVFELRNGDCRCWRGNRWASDPQITFQLRLCRRGRNVEGKLGWRSERAGLVVRDVGGVIAERSIELADRTLLKERPKRGHRFCKIDKYVLSFDAKSGALAGDYWSSACQDRGRLSLDWTGKETCAKERMHFFSD